MHSFHRNLGYVRLWFLVTVLVTLVRYDRYSEHLIYLRRDNESFKSTPQNRYLFGLQNCLLRSYPGLAGLKVISTTQQGEVDRARVVGVSVDSPTSMEVSFENGDCIR